MMKKGTKKALSKVTNMFAAQSMDQPVGEHVFGHSTYSGHHNPYLVNFRCMFKKSFGRAERRFVAIELCMKQLELTYSDGKVKQIHVSKVVQLEQHSSVELTLYIDHGDKQRIKRMCFDYEEEADRFVNTLNALKTSSRMELLFREMDSACIGVLHRDDIEAALRGFLRKPSSTKQKKEQQQQQDGAPRDGKGEGTPALDFEEEIKDLVPYMIRVASNVGVHVDVEDGVTYADFFMFFSAAPPASTEECISHWVGRANTLRYDPGGAGNLGAPRRPYSETLRRHHRPGAGSMGQGFGMVPGEVTNNIHEGVRCAFLCKGGDLVDVGTLYLTNYRLVFAAYSSHRGGNRGVPVLAHVHIPVATIARMDLGKSDDTISVVLKDLRRFQFTFFTLGSGILHATSTFAHILEGVAFPLTCSSSGPSTSTPTTTGSANAAPQPNATSHGATSPPPPHSSFTTTGNPPSVAITSSSPAASHLVPASPSNDATITTAPSDVSMSQGGKVFAFSYTPEFKDVPGWSAYDPLQEFKRQGCFDRTISTPNGKDVLPSSVWRVLDQTSVYSLAPSYPRYLVVPARMGNGEIEKASEYRSKRRFPAVTYRESISGYGAVLCRSSQPNAGVSNKSNDADCKLLEFYRLKGHTNYEVHRWPTLQYNPPPSPGGMKDTMNLLNNGGRPLSDRRGSVRIRQGVAALAGIASMATGGSGSLSGSSNSGSTGSGGPGGGPGCGPGGPSGSGGGGGSSSHSSGRGAIGAPAHGRHSYSHHHGHHAIGDAHASNGGPDAHMFYILDCRGNLAAVGNQVKGKGSEDTSNYNNTSLEFCNIGNIHTMRASLERLSDAVLPWGGDGGTGMGEFWGMVHDSGWLTHLRLLMAAAVNGAEKLSRGQSVLVHCSDGWDRTSQVCASIQILLDPYFRTLRGFAVLMEKDWCGFGFKFAERCGHGVPCLDSSERSPIIVQWLDLVHQLALQFPSAFEFNQELLVFVADHVHTCLFGNFLGNNERERTVMGAYAHCTSIWDYVLCEANVKKYKNPHFEPTEGAIVPSVSSKQIRLWERYFCRWDTQMRPSPVLGAVWQDDWGSHQEPQEPVVAAEAAELGLSSSDEEEVEEGEQEEEEGGATST